VERDSECEAGVIDDPVNDPVQLIVLETDISSWLSDTLQDIVLLIRPLNVLVGDTEFDGVGVGVCDGVGVGVGVLLAVSVDVVVILGVWVALSVVDGSDVIVPERVQVSVTVLDVVVDCVAV
jgi:hypothetical protein